MINSQYLTLIFLPQQRPAKLSGALPKARHQIPHPKPAAILSKRIRNRHRLRPAIHERCTPVLQSGRRGEGSGDY